MNRLTLTTYTDSYNSSNPTPAQHFTYDTPDTGVHLPAQYYLVGRLSTSYTMDSGGNYIGARAYSYDPVGRVNTLSECTIDDCPSMWYYELFYGYDIDGNVLSDALHSAANDPIDYTMTYSYNALGQLTQMQSSLADSTHPGTLFSSGTYGPMGGLVSDTLGNGATENYHYTLMNRLGCENTTKGSTTLYSVRLSNANGQCTSISWNGYAGDGNVVESQDSINGTWTYQYDDMNRLISATQAAGTGPLGSSGGTVSWTYDRFGNRWSQSVTGQTPETYTFTHNGTALDHRMEQYRSSYDPAGNLTWDPPTGNYLTYDDENRVIKVGTTAGASNIAQYWYDAEGQRIRKVSAAGTEEYVYDVAGRQIAGMQPNGSFNRVELYAGSRHLANVRSLPEPGADGIHAQRLAGHGARSLEV